MKSTSHGEGLIRCWRPGAVATLILLTLGLSACFAQDSPAEAVSEGGGEVVARVGGQPVTMADLEAAAAPQLRQLEAQRRAILEQVLAQVVEEKLVEVEAATRGVDSTSLVNLEIDSRAAPVTDAEVDAWYEENSARVRQPKEAVAAQIRQFLERERSTEARDAFLDGLREKHRVRILLEPPRTDVEVAGAPSKGPDSAPVTIVEFSDFECPFCSRLNPVLAEVMANYGDKVRLVFRQFPLAMHPNARKAAEASLCADEQGSFWQMHDAMFADQRALDVEQLKATAARIGLDADRFASCLDSSQHAEAVEADIAAGQAAGVSGTPAMFINGRLVSGAVPYEQVAQVIDDELERKRGGD